jgi:hypothetical protein
MLKTMNKIPGAATGNVRQFEMCRWMRSMTLRDRGGLPQVAQRVEPGKCCPAGQKNLVQAMVFPYAAFRLPS